MAGLAALAALMSLSSMAATGRSQVLHFAQFGNGGGLFSQLLLFNLSESAEANLEILLRDDRGEPLTTALNGHAVPGRIQAVIPPSGLRVFESDGLGEPVVGSVTVASSQPLGGVIVFGGGVGVSGVGSASEGLTGFLAPIQTSDEESINTGIAIVNLQSATADLELTLLDSEGAILSRASLKEEDALPQQGHKALFISEFDWLPEVDFGSFEGLLRVTASEEVAATVIQTRPGEFVTMPVTPVEMFDLSPGSVLNFAHFGEGGGQLFSELRLFNRDAVRDAAVRLMIRGDDGSFLEVDLNQQPSNGELTTRLPAGGMRVFRTDGLGEVRAGSVTVDSDRPIAGTVLFAGQLGAAGVGSSARPLAAFRAPVESDFEAKINTGIAVMSLEGEPVTAELTLYDRKGSIVGSARLEKESSISPFGHLARFVDQFDWAPRVDLTDFQGTVKLEASGLVAATVLQTRGAQFATMPVAPLAPEISSVVPTSLPPGTMVAIAGRRFAYDPSDAGQRANRVLIVTETGLEVTLPSLASSSELVRATVPPIPIDGVDFNRWLSGPVVLCLETDGVRSCHSEPLTIQPPAQSAQPVGRLLEKWGEDLMESTLQMIAADAPYREALADFLKTGQDRLKQRIQDAVDGNPQMISLQLADGRRLEGLFDLGALRQAESLLAALPDGQLEELQRLPISPLGLQCASGAEVMHAAALELRTLQALQEAGTAWATAATITLLTACVFYPAGCPALGAILSIWDTVLRGPMLVLLLRELELKYVESKTLLSLQALPPIHVDVGDSQSFQVVGNFGPFGSAEEALSVLVVRQTNDLLFRILGAAIWGSAPRTAHDFMAALFLDLIQRLQNDLEIRLDTPTPEQKIPLGLFSITPAPREDEFARLTLACPPSDTGSSFVVGKARVTDQNYQLRADTGHFITRTPAPPSTTLTVTVGDAPDLRILAPNEGEVFSIADDIAFRASADSSPGSAPEQWRWTSDRLVDVVLSTDQSFTTCGDDSQADGCVPTRILPSGYHRITLEARNHFDEISSAGVRICVASLPLARDDNAAADADRSITFSVLRNDTDPAECDGVNPALRVDGLDTSDTRGLVTRVDAAGTQLRYDPNGQFDHLNVGETALDRFSYSIPKAAGGQTVARVTITVTGVASAPAEVVFSLGGQGAGEKGVRFTNGAEQRINYQLSVDFVVQGSLVRNQDGLWRYDIDAFQGAVTFSGTARDIDPSLGTRTFNFNNTYNYEVEGPWPGGFLLSPDARAVFLVEFPLPLANADPTPYALTYFGDNGIIRVKIELPDSVIAPFTWELDEDYDIAGGAGLDSN